MPARTYAEERIVTVKPKKGADTAVPLNAKYHGIAGSRDFTVTLRNVPLGK